MWSLPKGHVHRYTIAMPNPTAVSLAKWGAGSPVQFEWPGHPSQGVVAVTQGMFAHTRHTRKDDCPGAPRGLAAWGLSDELAGAGSQCYAGDRSRGAAAVLPR
jgi:hypothetical protein